MYIYICYDDDDDDEKGISGDQWHWGLKSWDESHGDMSLNTMGKVT